MRIVRLYPTLPPYPGGVEQHVVRLSEWQRKSGATVMVLYNHGESGAESDVQVGKGVPLYRLRPRALRDLVFYCCCAVRLHRMHVKADVVHVHGDWSAFLCGRFISLIVGANVSIASVHDHLRQSSFWDFVYRRVLRSFDLSYSTGQREACRLTTLLRRETPWITSGLHQVFQQTALEALAPKTDTKCDVITVATLTRRKRLELVIAIAALLPQRRFWIVGDGPERERLLAHAQQMGVRNITFCGHLAVTEVRRCYLSARVFLLTSSTEGTPTVMLEAMACGLPVVTSASNDFRCLLDEHVTGYVVAGNDAADYAQRIERLLSDATAQARIGNENRLRARRYFWPAIAERVTAEMSRRLEMCN
jgi:glycosyltransferase involved in cell wall biosynthesis